MNETPTVLYHLLEQVASRFPEKISFRRRDKQGQFPGISFQNLLEKVDALVAGWHSIGLQIGDRVGYFCDASPHWLCMDLSILSAGAVVVPRGTDIVEEEIIYILNHSEARFVVVQKESDRLRIQKLKDRLPNLDQIFVLEADNGEWKQGDFSVSSLYAKGKSLLSEQPSFVKEHLRKVKADDLATLIYTSGTTGNPKGVMLSQKGWITAIRNTIHRLGLREDDTAVSLLPPWHAFERAVEYATLSLGNEFLVSYMACLKEDLREFKPSIFPSVPRIWESVYNGIMAKVAKEGGLKESLFLFFLSVGKKWAKHIAVVKGYDFQILKPNFFSAFFKKTISLFHLFYLSPFKLLSLKIFSPIHQALGGRIRVCISAGSALPSVVDGFLSAIGMKVLEGYGMTETSAVVSIRSNDKPTGGTVGVPIGGYQIRLKDDKGNILTAPGEKGTLWIKSDQILKGYYKRPELNQVVFDSEGFFDTGDLMMLSYRNELIFAGRSKDTIALIGGENIEPVPIEDKLLTSPYIDQVMVVGHDKKTLGALIVPHFETIDQKYPNHSGKYKEWNEVKEIRDLFKSEISRIISKENGFKSFEVIPINQFYLVPRQFDPDKEMTRTLKMKRNVISETFKNEIERLFQ